jgi:threonine dehydrogenase-like Zn-dependent dehydrogenase
MPKQRFEVQRHLDQVSIAGQNGDVPRPRPGEVLLKMVACGICGADIRVVTRNKTAPEEPDRYITLGHEGVGRILTLSDNAPHSPLDEYVIILPHIHRRQHVEPCSAPILPPPV